MSQKTQLDGFFLEQTKVFFGLAILRLLFSALPWWTYQIQWETSTLELVFIKFSLFRTKAIFPKNSNSVDLATGEKNKMGRQESKQGSPDPGGVYCIFEALNGS